MARPARAGRQASDEELLAGYLRWHLADRGDGGEQFREWLRGYRSWCASVGSSPFEVHRLAWQRRRDGSLVHEAIHAQLPGGV